VKDFAALYTALDASTSTLHKVEALAAYLRAAPPADAAWAVYVLAGGKSRQVVNSRLLRDAAREAAGLPEWLFEESYLAVGDLAETIAHLLPPADATDDAGLAQWLALRLPSLRGAAPDEARQTLRGWWAALDWNGRFVLNKLITGGFRVGVSRLLVVRALARAGGLDEALVAQRMIGYTDARRMPDAAAFGALVAPADTPGARGEGQPYPFFLAHALAGSPASLGTPADWLVEWKWDGIRAQLVVRGGRAWLWSRGEELVTERFPEIERAALDWAGAVEPAGAGVVFDGEVLAWEEAGTRPLPFAVLQKRVTRTTLTPAVLRAAPAVFLAYDLLEWHGEDWRNRPQRERRGRLESLLAPAPASPPPGPMESDRTPPPGAAALPRLRLSPAVPVSDWDTLAALRAQSRSRGVEGFMLKRLSAPYGAGRTRADGGDWWKWKVDPYTVDAVLVYAQRGHGRRASLYTDYTFAVWDRVPDGGPRTLLPCAKAYSGLTDAEIAQVDAIVRRTTVESFGPVRSVTPSLVFELGFEGIAPSPRHRSGVALRFPRILRWRTDKPPDDADTLATLRALLAPGSPG